ncbi:hypothetical protein OUZ56_009616 [Daphnia magna]|uniref:Uncharacterized protein n=1 Tax=Daphnia magna TaxID=35525 RepID=A0ABR0AGJ4_9CRUS|nr:hypothetical protein OUZ56_009616 [Daphnia magna]
MFSMENVSEHLLYRKKQIAHEFGEEGDDEDDDRFVFRNQLAILESEPEPRNGALTAETSHSDASRYQASDAGHHDEPNRRH